jgi:hypothetical protein
MDLEGISQKEWADLYIQLYAYADNLLKSYKWFRIDVEDTYLKGKEAKDYVMEAVARHLEHPEKYDPAKRSLLGYLKMHVIRTLAGNDARSVENRVSDDRIAARRRRNDIGSDDISEHVMPYVEVMYDGKIDYPTIIGEVRREIDADESATIAFEKICCGGKTRAEVIQEEGWPPDKFDNAMKRLNRARVKVAERYGLKQNR